MNYAAVAAANYASLPFGDGYTAHVSGTYGDQDNSHFAQLDRDAESGTDHAQFRQYDNTWGRWMSPDPYNGSYDITNPQSFNRYVYAMNNPLNSIDPTGLDENGDGGCDAVWHPCSGVTVNGSNPVVDPGDPLFPWGTLGGGTGTGNPNTPNNPDPCASAGNAPGPSTYAQKGQAASSNAFKDIYNLYSFRRGGTLDAQVGPGPNGQPFRGSPAYANYSFGVYMSAAGYTLGQALSLADIYAEFRSRYPVGTPFAGPNYPFTPQANVTNITNGFNAQKTGTTCHKPG